MPDYAVDLDLFSGPLDLLLHLVKRNEIDVNEVALAQVAAQFAASLDAIALLDLDLAGEFLVTAGTLLEIKSRTVLPQDEIPQAAEEVPDLARSDLVRRLLEYRKFKDAAAELEARATAWQQHYPRLSVDQPTDPGDPGEDRIREVELWDLVSALGRVLRAKTAEAGTANIEREEMPVSEIIERLAARAGVEGRISFSSCFAGLWPDGQHDRVRIVGVFMAILELVRHQGYTAQQPVAFGEIWIEPPGVN